MVFLCASVVHVFFSHFFPFLFHNFFSHFFLFFFIKFFFLWIVTDIYPRAWRASRLAQKGRWGGKLGSGWEGTGIGHWWGGNTIQGLLPYFYARHAPQHLSVFREPSDALAVEVDRCLYDNMVDSAVRDPPPNVGASACRQTPIAEVKFVHFTVCQKPWTCNPNRDPDDAKRPRVLSFSKAQFSYIFSSRVSRASFGTK